MAAAATFDAFASQICLRHSLGMAMPSSRRQMSTPIVTKDLGVILFFNKVLEVLQCTLSTLSTFL